MDIFTNDFLIEKSSVEIILLQDKIGLKWTLILLKPHHTLRQAFIPQYFKRSWRAYRQQWIEAKLEKEIAQHCLHSSRVVDTAG